MRRRPRLTSVFLGGALGLAVLTAACGGSGIDRDAEAALLAESFGFSQSQARCVVDLLIEEIGDDRLVELNEDEPTPQEVDQLFGAIDTCGGASSSLFGDADVADIADSFGITDDEARCVVDLAVDRIGADRLAELGTIAGQDPEGAEVQELLGILAECGG